MTVPASLLRYHDQLLLGAIGLDPLGAVIGVSVMHPGPTPPPGLRDPVELDGHSRAATLGYQHAFAELVALAEVRGADGVYLDEWGARQFDNQESEYHAYGTALQFRTRPGALRTPAGHPFLVDVTGTATTFYRFLRQGLCPVTFGHATCVYRAPHRHLREALGATQASGETELPVLSAAWGTARAHAVTRLTEILEQAGSEVIVDVGLYIDDESDGSEDGGNDADGDGPGEHTASFNAFGQGMRRMPELTALIPEIDLSQFDPSPSE